MRRNQILPTFLLVVFALLSGLYVFSRVGAAQTCAYPALGQTVLIADGPAAGTLGTVANIQNGDAVAISLPGNATLILTGCFGWQPGIEPATLP